MKKAVLWIITICLVISLMPISPFAVYAVKEAQEPEIKVITTNVNVDSNNLIWLWISIAVVVVVSASIIFVVIKKKNQRTKQIIAD